ncbi:solute carrier family 35 member G1 isoform X2 [Folsomia candida]|uniref:EamA domain-containing protein n=1 Tax=Folsomia candida TaxID=158441 RepID=A0A226ESM5_FOLCA|nr:solute carrier family 35 member G1 isoform X2 [Folsomia candida]OXA60250.1 hypothetical protein Fcan01_04147 [Folsomia candida]
MSGSIDFPEYLDVGLSTTRRPSEENSRRRDSRANSVQSNDGGGDCESNRNNVLDRKLSSAPRRSSTVSITKNINSAGGESTMMAARSSIASLKNTLEKSLGFSNRDEFLVPGEEVDPGDDALVVEVVVANQGKNPDDHRLSDYLRPGLSKSDSSLHSIESIASSWATSQSSINDEKVTTEKKDVDDSDDSDEPNATGCRKYIGLTLTLLSGLLYSLAALLAKLLKDDYHPFMISIWRFQGVFAPSILLVLYRVVLMKQPDFKPVWPLKTREKVIAFTVLMLRGILGCWSVILQFYSLLYLEVADSMVITSSTSVFVTLLAHCFIGEKCAIVPIITALLTMAGVVVISRPPMLTGKESFDTDILIGVCMALGCMILAAAILVIQRYLRNSHFSLISLSSGVWGTLQCVIFAFAIGVFKLPQNATDAMYGVALAVITFFAQSFIIIALKFEQAGPVAVVQSCDVIFAFLWQFAFLGVVPDYFSLIGSMIIIAGLLLTAFRKCLTVLPEDHRSRRRFRFLLM